MNTYPHHEAVTVQAATVLADQYGPSGPPWPAFLIIPILIWLTIAAFVVIGRRRFRGRSGESALRDGYARGEITEAQYRERLAVLKETR